MLKKSILFFMFIFLINSSIFSLTEGYISVNMDYKYNKVFIGDTDPIGNEKGMLGFKLNCFGFWDEKKIGLFTTFATLRPIYVTQGNTGSGIYSGSLIDFNIGVGFKLPTENRFTFLFGLGLNFNTEGVNIYMIDSQKYHKYDDVKFGIGGEAAVTFNLTPNFFLILGLNVAYSFLNYTQIYETYKNVDSGWSFPSMIGTDIFLGIGLNTIYDPSKNK